MTVGHWIVILLFGGALLYGVVLVVYSHGYTKGYRKGFDDAIKACGAGEEE